MLLSIYCAERLASGWCIIYSKRSLISINISSHRMLFHLFPAFKKIMVNITESQFEEMFQPIFDEEDSWVKDELKPDCDARRVWTMIEGDDSHDYIIPGIHLVNKLYYIETITPWDRDDYTVHC